uniref:Uncharacterized protein n=1 Tax=viral metagenome TaxID=1070528 RepID=A0A6C0JBK2_9ZZZZ
MKFIYIHFLFYFMIFKLICAYKDIKITEINYYKE